MKERIVSYYDTSPEHISPLVKGIPKDPVVAVPKIDVVGSSARRYESRTYGNGGIVVVSSQRPSEVAVNRHFRPKVDIIEVGQYRDGNFDLVSKIATSEGEVRMNGLTVGSVDDKVEFIGRIIKQKRVNLMATHEQDERLVDLAMSWGVRYPENIGIFRDTTCKSGLNKSIESFRLRNSNSCLYAFGRTFTSFQGLIEEVDRLSCYGEGAYVKLDFAPQGQVNAGGEGQLALPRELTTEERMNKLESFVKNRGNGKDVLLSGVVQLMVPEPYILSISSGQSDDGNYVIYETHLQTQDGNTAAGALPLPDTAYSRFLLRDLWPELAKFYDKSGVTGRQNMNFIVIPSEMHEKVKFIYGDQQIPSVMPIDLNYRDIAGTKNAMSRYEEETMRRVNQRNFRSNGVGVHSFYAANPHLIYVAAKDMGLEAGVGGNFSVINMGTFEPEFLEEGRCFKTQVFVNDVDDPGFAVQKLEVVLESGPSRSLIDSYKDRCYDVLALSEACNMSEQGYAELIMRNLRRVSSR